MATALMIKALNVRENEKFGDNISEKSASVEEEVTDDLYVQLQNNKVHEKHDTSSHNSKDGEKKREASSFAKIRSQQRQTAASKTHRMDYINNNLKVVYKVPFDTCRM